MALYPYFFPKNADRDEHGYPIPEFSIVNYSTDSEGFTTGHTLQHCPQLLSIETGEMVKGDPLEIITDPAQIGRDSPDKWIQCMYAFQELLDNLHWYSSGYVAAGFHGASFKWGTIDRGNFAQHWTFHMESHNGSEITIKNNVVMRGNPRLLYIAGNFTPYDPITEEEAHFENRPTSLQSGDMVRIVFWYEGEDIVFESRIKETPSFGSDFTTAKLLKSVPSEVPPGHVIDVYRQIPPHWEYMAPHRANNLLGIVCVFSCL